MSGPSIQFHKIWIEQCRATEDIRERFGLEDAIRYLIGEKLLDFVRVSEDDPDFAKELPAFVAEIRRLFSAAEIREFLAPGLLAFPLPALTGQHHFAPV